MAREAVEISGDFAWEQAKRSTESARPAGVLLEAHTRVGDDLRDQDRRLRSAASAAEGGDDLELLYRSHHFLGLHFEAQGLFESAEQAMRKAIDASGADPALSHSHAAVTNDHGVVLARLGRYSDADESFAKALQRDGKPESNRVALSAQLNSGLMTWLLGDSGKALRCWDAVFSTARERDDAAVNAEILNNVAVMRLLEGDSDEAVKLLNRAVLLAQRGGDIRGLAFMYNNIGLAYSGPPHGDHFAAVPFVEMALALLEGSVDVVARLYVLNNNILVYEEAHLEPARKFRAQLANTLKTFTTAFPSRSADVEHAAFARQQADSPRGASPEQEWEISAIPSLLRACSRCGVPE